jgi:hypothetical protein
LRHDVQLSILIVADKEMPNSAACQGKSVTGADLTDDRRRCRFQFFTITGSGFPEHNQKLDSDFRALSIRGLSAGQNRK